MNSTKTLLTVGALTLFSAEASAAIACTVVAIDSSANHVSLKCSTPFPMGSDSVSYFAFAKTDAGFAKRVTALAMMAQQKHFLLLINHDPDKTHNIPECGGDICRMVDSVSLTW